VSSFPDEPRGAGVARLRVARSALLLAFLLLASVGGAPGAVRDWKRPARDWNHGPVRYLLTGEEEARFRALTTDEERARFIEDFWARRDDDPSTPANEFEIRFWKRVAEADRLFLDAPYPGWKTDRGKLYVLLGPADEIRTGSLVGARGREIPYTIWVYQEPRFEGMERGTEIRFVREGSGEFKLSDRLFLNRLERAQDVPGRLAFQATLAQKAPEPRQILDTIVAARPAMDPVACRTHYDFFKAADGSTSVVLTVGVRMNRNAPSQAPPSEAWKVYARLAGEKASYDLVEPDSFRTSKEGLQAEGFRLYQGRISVPPGLYTVYYGIREESTGKLLPISERLQVPDYAPERLSISGITLVSRLDRVGSPEPAQPFVIGRLLVIPKTDPLFKTGEDFGFYFQVYGPRLEPESGRVSLDLTCRFYRAAAIRKTGEVTFELMKTLLFENQPGQVHGYTFPLTGWPAGEYKLEVTVRDRGNDSTAAGETSFSVR